MKGLLQSLKIFIIFTLSLTYTGCKPKNEETTLTVRPVEIRDTLINPGKGWVLYGLPFNQSARTLEHAAIGYGRFDWCDIEPMEGKFNWSIIDEAITQWSREGKRYAFGVMCANTSSSREYVTPKWVFDAGAKYTDTLNDAKSTTQHIPVWDDPIFLNKYKEFLFAMSSRYDGNPNLEFVDIRSYGNWGEGHLWPFEDTSTYISDDKLLEHIDMHKEAFKKTQLILPWGNEKYDSIYKGLGIQEIGLRRDGIMGVQWNGSKNDGHECMLSYGYAPSVYEFINSYSQLVNQKLWSADKLRKYINVGKPSYVGMGQWDYDAQLMFSKEHKLIDELANRMGYHFIIKEAKVPRAMKEHESINIEFKWKNKGVSPIYIPCKVALALLDNKDNVKSISWAIEANPSSWLPDSTSAEKYKVEFSKIKSGTYKLCVGLFTNDLNNDPTIKLGIKGRTKNGWYYISDLKVE